jgi:hypothetical protein
MLPTRFSHPANACIAASVRREDSSAVCYRRYSTLFSKVVMLSDLTSTTKVPTVETMIAHSAAMPHALAAIERGSMME